jgi:outer membrane protein TolC
VEADQADLAVIAAQQDQQRQRAYELYLQKYREGAAGYPQVLITQRTLFDLETRYISFLEDVWINAITLQGLYERTTLARNRADRS